VSPKLSPTVERAIDRLAREATVSTLLHATARELVDLLEAPRCSISRAVGDLLVEVTEFRTSGTTPTLDLYLASDYPLTQEVLERGEPRLVSLGTADVDPAEAELLRRLGFSELLMLPLSSRGHRWGLVEIYTNERPFARADVETGQALLGGTEAALGALEHG